MKIDQRGLRNGDNWYYRAEKAVREERYREALDCCREALKEDSHNVEALLYQGYLHATFFRDYDQALSSYDQALEIDPRDARVWRLKGKTFYNQDRFKKAISCYNQALKLDPHDAETWEDKGDAVNCLGGRKNALTYYLRAIDENPAKASCWFIAGLTYEELDRTGHARECYEKAVETAGREDEEIKIQARIKLEQLNPEDKTDK